MHSTAGDLSLCQFWQLELWQAAKQGYLPAILKPGLVLAAAEWHVSLSQWAVEIYGVFQLAAGDLQ